MNAGNGRLVAAPTGKGGGWAWRKSGKGRRGRRPLRWDRTVFACFQSSRRDTIMRQGAIHAEGNSWQSQFMPVRAIHWPSAVMPPPAGCHVRNRKCLTTPPAFCPDKKPPPLTRGGMGAVRTRRKKGKCGARGEVTGSEKVGAAICRPPTPDHNRRNRAAGSRPYIGERTRRKKG